MIRITQTYLINFTITHYTHQGWELLYKDLPGGRRSGMGQTASINELWEGIYNLSPDILLYKDGNLLLFEVDSSLNSEYLNKLKKYKKKENELISRLEIILNVKIDKIDYGFIAKSVQIPESIPIDLYPFTYMGYDKETHTLKGKIYKTG